MAETWRDRKELRDESAKRRENPMAFFQQFLSDLWKDNTQDEAEQLWATKCEYFPWYAEDVLACLDYVLADPPADLMEMLSEHGWVILYHEMDLQGVERRFTFDETVDWLRAVRESFRALYASSSRTS